MILPRLTYFRCLVRLQYYLINQMKRNHLMIMMQQMQKENIRLKDEIIQHHKQLSNFQNAMIQQLTKIGKVKPFYETPFQCLQAYVEEFESNLMDHLSKTAEIQQLKISLTRSKKQNKELLDVQNDLTRKKEELSEHLRTVEMNHKDIENTLKEELSAVIKKQKGIRDAYDEMVKQHDIRDMEREEETRMTISAAIASTKQDMIQYRGKLELQFQQQSENLREEIKNRDESFKQLAKSFSGLEYRNEIKNEQISRIDMVLEKVLNFEQLTSQITSLRDQCSEQKKMIQDISNKKLHFEIRLSELKTEITNHESKFKRKEKQNQTLTDALRQIQLELQQQKKGNKTLEHYYEQKWVHEFNRVKQNIERHYQERILGNQRELEAKKTEISRKIDSYLFIHEEDQKYIRDLKEKIELKDRGIRVLEEEITDLKNQMTEINKTIWQTNHMIMQSQQFFREKVLLKQQNHLHHISVLQKQKVDIQTEYLKAKEVVEDVEKELSIKFQQKKQELLKLHEQEIIKMVQKQEDAIKAIQQSKQQKNHEFQEKEQLIREEYEEKILAIEKKVDQVREQKEMQNQIQRKNFKEFAAVSLKKQKTLKREVQTLRAQLQSKFQYLQLQLQSKKSSLKFQIQKSQKDKSMKLQLRQLLDQKIDENKTLLKQKLDYLNQIEAKDSEINFLSHELEQHRFMKNDWVRLTDQLKEQFMMDLQELNRIYSRQSDILKSKIWELENIILTRPIRAKDQLKIRHLSQKKRELQSMVELKQAENGVLKQLKYYYEKKQVKKHPSEGALNLIEHRKGPSVLIMTRKHKKARASQFDLSNCEMGQTGELREDVQKMKHYIARKFRQEASKESRDDKEVHSTRFKTVYYTNQSVDK